MDMDPIRATLERLTKDRSAVRARIEIFEYVRDLPIVLAGSDEARIVLAEGRGSGTGKHQVLAALLHAAGCRVRHALCSHRFNESPIAFPDDMQLLLRKNEILDVHHFLQIEVAGAWIDIDATWNAALRPYGFPVNDEWDGAHAMALGAAPDEIRVVEAAAVGSVREELLASLTPRQRQIRMQFRNALDAYVAECLAESSADE